MILHILIVDVRWGNRLTRTMINTKHLLEGSTEDIFKTIQDELECEEQPEPEDEDDDPPEEPRQHRPRRRRQVEEPETLDVRNYNFGTQQLLLFFSLQTFWIISEHPANLPLANYNAQQCVHCVKKDLDDLIHYDEPKHQTRKLDYSERLCEEHTYTALQGKEYRPRYGRQVLASEL